MGKEVTGQLAIVLRDHANEFNNDGPHDNPKAHPDLYRQAADEIERLTRLLWEIQHNVLINRPQ